MESFIEKKQSTPHLRLECFKNRHFNRKRSGLYHWHDVCRCRYLFLPTTDSPLDAFFNQKIESRCRFGDDSKDFFLELPYFPICTIFKNTREPAHTHSARTFKRMSSKNRVPEHHCDTAHTQFFFKNTI